MQIQARQAKAAMIAAGFDRKDIKVRSETDGGGVLVICNAPKQEQHDRIDAAIAQGFRVTVYRKHSDSEYTCWPSHDWDGHPGLKITWID